MSSDPFNRPSRAFDQHGSGGASTDRRPAQASDPLLELARLIGQSDPFAPAAPRAVPGRDATDYPDRDGVGRSAPQDDDAMHAHRYVDESDRYADESHHEELRPVDRAAPPPFFPLRPSATDRSAYPAHDEHSAADGYSSGSHDHEEAQDHYGPEAEYAEHASDDGDPAYAQEGEYAGEYAEEVAYTDDPYAYGDASGEDYGDTHPPLLKRRNATKVVIAVLGLAVFGSAAAFGYRTVFKGGTQGTPIIHADTSPTKVVPSPSSADAGTKTINDRLGDGGAERLVSREERPVDIRDASRGVGAVVPGTGSFAGVGGFPSAPATPPSSTSPSSASPSSTEPKRVRTVTIRAEQGTALAQDRAAPPPPPQQRASASARQPAASGGPLALAPQSTAAADPAPAAPPARTPAATPRNAEGGGFVVQLSAQKSEAEAQSTFRALQSKYAVLNGLQPLIRRKDQGERGVFYAAQVGPYTSRDEANQLCESIKSAGGSCFIAKN